MVMLVVVVRAEGGNCVPWLVMSDGHVSTVMLVSVDDAEPCRGVCTRYMADEALQMPGAGSQEPGARSQEETVGGV